MRFGKRLKTASSNSKNKTQISRKTSSTVPDVCPVCPYKNLLCGKLVAPIIVTLSSVEVAAPSN